jgi:DNA processing protein
VERALLWMALSRVKRLGPRTLAVLLEAFGDLDRILGSTQVELTRFSGVSPEMAQGILEVRDSGGLQNEFQTLQEKGVCVIGLDDTRYPQILKEIPDSPLVLYVKGRVENLIKPSVALVGSRAASEYGKRVCEILSSELAKRGICVVSGLARGIDAASHRGALQGEGSTVGVLGHGLGEIYPSENRGLAKEILLKGGTLLSEFDYAMQPEPGFFPRRNRVISGLSLGVVVVEAQRKSGSLITARFANEQGREVFAVPGQVTSPRTEGVHRLIQDGAKLVHGVQDILDEFPQWKELFPKKGSPAPSVSLQGSESRIHSLLSDEPKHIDQLVLDSTLPAHEVAQGLMKLSIYQLARELPGKRFVREEMSL